MNDLVALDMADDPEKVKAEIVKLRKSLVEVCYPMILRLLPIEIIGNVKRRLERGEVKADDPIVVRK